MSAFVLSCIFAYAMQSWHHPASQPRVVCSAIERQAATAQVDPYLMAAIAWHESSFIPGLISPDGKDMGSMQVRVVIMTGNKWLRVKGGQVCTKSHVLTVEGGVECGILAYKMAEEWFQYKWAGRGPYWPKKSVMGCYACCMSCPHVKGAREIEAMAQTLRELAGYNHLTQECQEL